MFRVVGRAAGAGGVVIDADDMSSSRIIHTSHELRIDVVSALAIVPALFGILESAMATLLSSVRM